jgi:perosamine synthetase
MLNISSSVSRRDGEMAPDKKIVMFFPYVSPNASQQLLKLIHSRWIGQGAVVSDFEKAFQEALHVKNAVAVNSVTSAIRLALAISGVGPGDEVITSPQTCTATNFPILEQFATPIFADIQYNTGNRNPEDIANRITKRTKAILCSHWGGYPCDMEEIHSIAKRFKLTVIEDASDAVGASYKNCPIGSLSPFTCFSFRAVQQITSAEGGMLCALSEANFKAALRRRWFGIDKLNRKPNSIGYFDFDIDETGYGYHMTNIHAAIGLANIQELDSILKKREHIVGRYKKALGEMDGITLFESNPNRKSSFGLFTLHVQRREDFCKILRARGVETSIVHDRNDKYSVFGGLRKDLPHLDSFSKTHISLPLHNQLDDRDVDHIIKSIKAGW